MGLGLAPRAHNNDAILKIKPALGGM